MVRARRDIDLAVAETASQQRLAFGRWQVLDAGGDDSLIARRVRSGRWMRVIPSVYTLPGWSPSWMRDLWIAHLGNGPESVISFESAAAGHRFDGFPRGPVVVTVSHPSHPRATGADTVHQINDVLDRHRCKIGTLPVTTPARTIVDLGMTASAARLRAAFESALAHEAVTLGAVERVLADIVRPGKRGLVPVGMLLDELGGDHVPAESELERLLFQAISTAGLPSPRRQIPLPGRDPRPGRVDGAYPEVRLIVEADGRRWHTRLRDLNRDHWRDQEAARVGWQTLRFVHTELVNDASDVGAAVRETYEVRARQLGVAVASSGRGIVCRSSTVNPSKEGDARGRIRHRGRGLG